MARDSVRSTRKAGLKDGAEYRVLSVHPAWAWAIIFAGKDVENRSWTTPYRGPILIHASSKKYSADALDEARRFIAKCSGIKLAKVPSEFPSSQILGLVELHDSVERRLSLGVSRATAPKTA